MGIIISALLILNIIGYVIANIKNIKYVEKLTYILLIPLIGLFVIINLIRYQPDSNHIIKLTAFATILISAAEVFISFKEKRFFKYIGDILFVLSLFPWITLYKSTFYIYKINFASLFISLICYIVIFGVLVILIGKQQKPALYAIIGLPLIFIDYINYCALVSLFIGKDAYALILYLGSGLLIYTYCFYVIQNIKPFKIKQKLENTILTSAFTLSEFLIMLAGLLMIN